ncbi:MAG: hypothetical protein KA275_08675 [Chitinophagaceae bacterium]|nr:hypothetical protein [Chitinophagaceae bacterium]
MRQNLKILCLILIIQSCTNTAEDKISKFIDKSKEIDFIKLKNKSFSRRGNDFNGNNILFVFKDGNDCGFIRFLLRKKTNEIISKENVYQKFNCYIDSTFVKIEDVKSFITLGISHLSIDSNLNSYVKFSFEEGSPDLIKVEDKKLLQEIKNKKWINIKDNWFKMP